MGGVDHQHVHTGGHQRLGTLDGIVTHADGGTDLQPSLAVLGGIGVLQPLANVLEGDEAAQPAVTVNHRELLDAVGPQQLRRLGQGGPQRHGHQTLRRHDLRHRSIVSVLKPQIPVGQDADKTMVVVNHRQTRDVVPGHQFEGVGHRLVATQHHRVGDHPRLRALDPVHL